MALTSTIEVRPHTVSGVKVRERGGILGVVNFDICVLPRAPCGSALWDVYPQLCNFTLQLPSTVAILERTVVA